MKILISKMQFMFSRSSKAPIKIVFKLASKELQSILERLKDKIFFLMLWCLHIKRIALKNFLQCSACLPARQVKRRMLFERVLRVSSFVLAKWKEILAIIFKVHASFGSFLTLRKEHIKTFLKHFRRISRLAKPPLACLSVAG